MGMICVCYVRWQAWAPGIPKCIDAKSEADLHPDDRFANEKRSDFEGSLHYAYVTHDLMFNVLSGLNKAPLKKRSMSSP